MLSDAMQPFDIPCYTLLRCHTLRNATFCYSMLYYALLFHAMPSNAMSHVTARRFQGELGAVPPGEPARRIGTPEAQLTEEIATATPKVEPVGDRNIHGAGRSFPRGAEAAQHAFHGI